jgi:uncharacterized repeat protein (TIGR01451 family)
LAYTATVTNHGPSGASSVLLTDTLPASASFVSATATQGSCSQAAGTVSCALGDLAASGTATITIQVTPRQTGTITDSAAVSANEGEPNPADNQAAEQTTVKAANAKIAFISDRDGNTEIYSMNPDGTDLTNLTRNAASDAYPYWSPDRTKIAFTSNRGGNSDIYAMNADGSAPTQLTTNAAADTEPAWSPDGTKITFVSNRDGNAEIYSMNRDGTGQVRLTTNTVADSMPDWSPDGQKIAFTRSNSIYVMNADGSGQKVVFAASSDTRKSVSARAPAWSPNGAKLAFDTTVANYRDYTSSTGISITNADGTGRVSLPMSGCPPPTNTLFTEPCNNMQPSWSPDGQKIAFTSDRDGTPGCNFILSRCPNREIYLTNLDGSGQTRLTNNPATDWFPDW